MLLAPDTEFAKLFFKNRTTYNNVRAIPTQNFLYTIKKSNPQSLISKNRKRATSFANVYRMNNNIQSTEYLHLKFLKSLIQGIEILS